MYVVDCFIAAERLRIFPKPFRRIVHWFLPESRRVRSHVAEARSIIQPVIDARAREKRTAAEQGRPLPTYDDAIQWGEEESAKSKYDPAIYQLALAGAAIHTTTDLVTQVILNILPRPDVVVALRAEMIDVLGREGWAKTSLYNLKLMDSVMKETQRLKPIQSSKSQTSPPATRERLTFQSQLLLAASPTPTSTSPTAPSSRQA